MGAGGIQTLRGGAVGKGYGLLVGEKWGRGCNLYLTASAGFLTLCSPVVAILTTSFNAKVRVYFSHAVCVFFYFLRL